jgi:hypothetical protein
MSILAFFTLFAGAREVTFLEVVLEADPAPDPEGTAGLEAETASAAFFIAAFFADFICAAVGGVAAFLAMRLGRLHLTFREAQLLQALFFLAKQALKCFLQKSQGGSCGSSESVSGSSS